MWSDNETAIDSVNVQHLVNTILALLRIEHLSPVTIGVYGDWGSGKSSVLMMLRDQLSKGERKQDTLCIVFNGWRFEGYEDAKSALMTTILEEIGDSKTLPAAAKTAAAKLLDRVNWLRVFASSARVAVHGGLAAITAGASLPASITAEAMVLAKDADASAWLKDAKDKRGAHQSVREFEREFAAVVRQTNLHRVVVMIDDLDRCSPDRVIETLEAIRLFLAVPSTAFIIAADEQMVQHAVRLKFPDMQALRESVGRDYLEKMIQIPVRVAPLSHRDLETYLNMLFLQLHLGAEEFQSASQRLLEKTSASPTLAVTAENAHEYVGTALTEEMKQDLALATQVRHVVALSVEGNPRQVKRYLNAFRLRLMVASARGVTLDPRVAAKLMLLEYFRVEAFRLLGRWQAAHNGLAPELAAIEALGTATTQRPTQSSNLIAPRREPEPAHRTGKKSGTAMASEPPPQTPEPNRDDATASQLAATGDDAEQLPGEAAIWLRDDWMRAWLQVEPLLGDKDLSPYFYFARDRDSIRGANTHRLSPAAQELLPSLLGKSQAVRDSAAKRVIDLTGVDVIGLHALLAERVRGSESQEETQSNLLAMLAVVSNRPELLTEFLSFLSSLPIRNLAPGLPSRLLLATRGGGSAVVEAARHLITKWSNASEHPTLAAAARASLAGGG